MDAYFYYLGDVYLVLGGRDYVMMRVNTLMCILQPGEIWGYSFTTILIKNVYYIYIFICNSIFSIYIYIYIYKWRTLVITSSVPAAGVGSLDLRRPDSATNPLLELRNIPWLPPVFGAGAEGKTKVAEPPTLRESPRPLWCCCSTFHQKVPGHQRAMDAKEQLRASLQDLQSGVAKWCCVMSFTDLLQGHSSCGGVEFVRQELPSGSTKTNSVCFSIAATLTTMLPFFDFQRTGSEAF